MDPACSGCGESTGLAGSSLRGRPGQGANELRRPAHIRRPFRAQRCRFRQLRPCRTEIPNGPIHPWRKPGTSSAQHRVLPLSLAGRPGCSSAGSQGALPAARVPQELRGSSALLFLATRPRELTTRGGARGSPRRRAARPPRGPGAPVIRNARPQRLLTAKANWRRPSNSTEAPSAPATDGPGDRKQTPSRQSSAAIAPAAARPARRGSPAAPGWLLPAVPRALPDWYARGTWGSPKRKRRGATGNPAEVARVSATART